METKRELTGFYDYRLKSRRGGKPDERLVFDDGGQEPVEIGFGYPNLI
ncbi:MAG: hypothetical protein GY841_12665 [FCB group bacterium]|nr:hypothetical protein [FCB group bacterium]